MPRKLKLALPLIPIWCELEEDPPDELVIEDPVVIDFAYELIREFESDLDKVIVSTNVLVKLPVIVV
jgi:hypothetical protein